MSTWLKDDRGNKCSVEYFGNEESAQKALDSLKNCDNCTNCSYCSRKKDEKGDFTPPAIPKIENIHAAIFNAASQPGALDMSTPHRCGTTHCRAGWAVVPQGYALVPAKPTPAMIEAGCEQNPTQWNEGTDLGFAADVANDVYVAMVRAAALSTPSDAVNESAEARLREALIALDERLRSCGGLHTAEDAYDSFYQDIVSDALSAGGDEAKKSEGGEPEVERTQRRLAVSDDGLGPMQVIPRETPSVPSDPPDRREIVALGLKVIPQGKIDKHLDAILTASGCPLRYFRKPNQIDRMRKALIDVLAALDGGR